MKLNFLFLLMIVSSALSAQNKTVAGKVQDASGNIAIPGATIIVRGTKSGTTTDNAGQFRLQVPSNATEIEVSFLNYKTQVVTIGASPLEVNLVRDVKGLDEVIVVGYGTQKKRDITGAISTIGAKDVGGRQTVQISEALQGSMPGVSVTRNNGGPGASSSILIRGITTLNNNSPLIIVDGVPVSNIDNVNPNDVENISVLKDGASAAIYGSRAAAGVILVTTKRGKKGQSTLDYTYEYGTQKATALPGYVGIQDYMRYFNEQLANDGTAPLYAPSFIDTYLDSNRVNPDKFPNTDWQRSVMKESAPRYRHDLVFTAGTDKLKTKASFGYQKSDALYDNYDFTRYQFRVNNDLEISSKLSGSLDVSYKHTDDNTPTYNPISDIRIYPAYYDDRYDDGRYAPGKDGFNPLAEVREGGFNQTKLNQFMGRVSLVLKPVEGLSVMAVIAPTFDMNKTKIFSKQIKFTDKDDPSRVINQNQASTTLEEQRAETFQINGQLLASYTKSFHDVHHLDILAGYEENYGSYEYLMASRDGFALNDFPYLSAGSPLLRNNGSDAYQYALHSTFGRLRYDYKNRYSIQGTLRYDQSSRFAKDYRGAIFPTVSAAWTASEEKFLQGNSWLNFLKIRGSWAKAGNERLQDINGNPSYYPYQASIPFTNALFYQNGNVLPLNGGNQQVYAVNDITWETTRSIDAGFDAMFLDNRLSLSADYFDKKTYNILLQLDIPNYLGFDNPFQNAGILNAKGWELEAGWKDHIGKLQYSIAANLSDTRTRIVDLKGTQFLGDQANIEGGEFNEWFGYKTDGLFQTPDELANSPKISTNTKVGDVKYVDVNGDKQITPLGDKVLLGGSLPRYLYGGNIRLDYSNFDLGIVVQGVGKKLSRMPSDIIQPFSAAFGNFPQELVGNFWSVNNSTEQNLAVKYPRLSRNSVTNNYLLSDLYLVNGAYFRVKNITLGYTLKWPQIQKIGMKSCRFYVAANDIFSIHHFPKYWDPEVGSNTYPIVQTFMIGATARF